MRIIQRLYAGWKQRTTAEKISLVLDVLTGVGSGMISSDIGKRLGEGHGRFGRACIRLTVFGATEAAGMAAKNQLQKNYGDILAGAIDTMKGKLNEGKKEENAHE